MTQFGMRRHLDHIMRMIAEALGWAVIVVWLAGAVGLAEVLLYVGPPRPQAQQEESKKSRAPIVAGQHAAAVRA